MESGNLEEWIYESLYESLCVYIRTFLSTNEKRAMLVIHKILTQLWLHWDTHGMKDEANLVEELQQVIERIVERRCG